MNKCSTKDILCIDLLLLVLFFVDVGLPTFAVVVAVGAGFAAHAVVLIMEKVVETASILTTGNESKS